MAEAQDRGEERKPKHPDPVNGDVQGPVARRGGRLNVSDEELAVMLEKSGGFQSRVARHFGVSPAAISKRVKKSPLLQETLRSIDITVLDIAESSLIKAAQAGEAWAVCFILKCKGRARGWIERQDIALAGDVNALPPPIVLAVHDPEFVEAERERQRREFSDIVDAAVVEMKPEPPPTEGMETETTAPAAQNTDAAADNGPTTAPTAPTAGPEPPQKAAEAPVSPPGKQEASVPPPASKAPQRPQEPPCVQHAPRTPSEAAAMRRAKEIEERKKRGAQDGAKPRFVAAPAAFPKR